MWWLCGLGGFWGWNGHLPFHTNILYFTKESLYGFDGETYSLKYHMVLKDTGLYMHCLQLDDTSHNHSELEFEGKCPSYGGGGTGVSQYRRGQQHSHAPRSLTIFLSTTTTNPRFFIPIGAIALGWWSIVPFPSWSGRPPLSPR